MTDVAIRPPFHQKFRPALVKTLIADVLAERLADKTYNSESSSNMSKEIADAIKSKIKGELELPRYKLIVQVVIGEQRGQGLRMGCRGFWDVDTDNYAEDTYRSDSLFCHAAAFGVYLY